MKIHSDYMVVVMKDKAFAGAVDVESGREYGTLLSVGDQFTPGPPSPCAVRAF